MNTKQEQFNKAQKTFSKKSLSDIQKNTMFSNIYSQSGETVIRPVVSPLSSYFAFFQQKTFIIATIIIFLISGTSYASAMSLPGDLLYGMKVNIIEPIGLTLRFSEESKNEYKISLLQKRVDELNKLKQRDYINNDSQKESSEATNKNVKELERSAIFDEKGENINVSENLELYNSLIDVNLKIETNIKIDAEEDIIINSLDSSINESNSSLDTEADVKIENQNDSPLNTDGNFDIETKIPKL